MNQSPRLAIGMPVYNGERFLRHTLESILGQTFRDFVVVICDNASTDATEDICRETAAADDRIRYIRNPENIGAGPNYRKVFRECPPLEFFKWAAHDDPYDPDFLHLCIDELDRDSAAVLCHSQTASIDADGNPFKCWPPRPELSSDDRVARLRNVLEHRDTYCIWGVTRHDVLARTPLLGDFPAHDRPLLAELALHGKLLEIDDVLFFDREHPDRSVRAFDASRPHEAAVWYDPRNRGKLIFPAWRLCGEYARAINRVPMPTGERAACFRELSKWSRDHREEFFEDLRVGAFRLPLVGAGLAKLDERRRVRDWQQRTRRAAKEMLEHCGVGARVILIDQGETDLGEFSDLSTLPLLGEDMAYGGMPATDAEAFEGLERGQENGATYLGVLWNAFWWWEHYFDFTRHIDHSFPCISRSKDLALFRLASKGGQD
ncbi:glycosyltransferase family 2 protein [Tropicimonas aquimaris]|uniref:Glycosyltransferase family 2 protein n=1 Tax=Tropicimonas aquimaris TaxID=914152 RepID=A0ABW3IQ89_9RHOB